MLLEQAGDLEEAQQMVNKALALQPDLITVNIAQGMLQKRLGHTKAAITTLEGVLVQQPQPDHAMAVHQALGLLYDRQQDAPRAFDHFSIGNRMQRDKIVDIEAHKAHYHHLLDHLEAHLDAGWVKLWHPMGQGDSGAPVFGRAKASSELKSARCGASDDAGSSDPIFLVGFPRSGTTLLDQVLDSHPNIQVLEEQPLLGSIFAELRQASGGYLPALAALDEKALQSYRQRYLREMARLLPLDHPGGLRVDKMPLNLVHAPLIARLFPEARMMFALRHPCDAVLSCFMQNFKINDAMVHFLSLEETTHLYTRLMALWQRAADVLPLRVHTVRYEGIVEDFRAEIAPLLHFLGVEWHDAVLKYDRHARSRAISTPSYQQVTQPIYAHARYRWMRYRTEMAPILDQLAPFASSFGYAMGDGKSCNGTI